MKAILNLNKNSEVILTGLLFITGFSIPFSYGFNSICFGILFLYSFTRFEKRTYLSLFNKKSLIPLLFISFFIIQVVGIVYAHDMKRASSNVIKNILLILLPITFINLSKSIDYVKVKASLYGLIVGITVIISSSYIHILKKIILGVQGPGSLLTYFVREEFVKEAIVVVHPPYLAFLVVFAIVPIWKLSFPENKVLRYLLLFYFLFALYSISSFMSFIILGILFVFYFISLIKKRKQKHVLVISTALILGLFLINNMNYKESIKGFRGGTLFKRIEWSFLKGKWDTSRPENWKSVWIVSKNNLALGVGSDGGLHQLQMHRNDRSESYINKHNAHNQYLEVLLRFGLIGLAVYLFLLYSLIVTAMQSRNRIFGWFLIVFVVSCLVESYLQRQIGLTFFVFYALLFNTFYKFDLLKNIHNEKSLSA
ncbi:hypothetical protein GCM10022393_06550 [Aquimarina addita]|uniref:O-antigen ligase-related domain-containing protein n=1 Tax=Aquimarina addita TaxID=870485 RepID=A0ABP7XAU4_9FLAO